jgi:hypothetical protein
MQLVYESSQYVAFSFDAVHTYANRNVMYLGAELYCIIVAYMPVLHIIKRPKHIKQVKTIHKYVHCTVCTTDISLSICMYEWYFIEHICMYDRYFIEHMDV